MDVVSDALGALFKIISLDLLLSGDNALVIALACRSLPPRHRRNALVIGTGGAIVFRLILTASLSLVLRFPYLKILGALALLAIAVKLALADDGAGNEADTPAEADQRFWSAVGIIIVADAMMSLDNVLAVAAVAGDNLMWLAFGLCLSIPFLVFGSLFVGALLSQFPVLVTAGAAFLGWIAGDLAVNDPAIANWVQHEAFALAFAVPLAGAVFVIGQSRNIAAQRAKAPPRPHRRPAQPAPPPPPVAITPTPMVTPMVPMAMVPMAAPAAGRWSAASAAIDRRRAIRVLAIRVLIVALALVVVGYVVVSIWDAAAIIGDVVHTHR